MKRGFALILTIVLVLGAIPATAIATNVRDGADYENIYVAEIEYNYPSNDNAYVVDEKSDDDSVDDDEEDDATALAEPTIASMPFNAIQVGTWEDLRDEIDAAAGTVVEITITGNINATSHWITIPSGTEVTLLADNDWTITHAGSHTGFTVDGMLNLGAGNPILNQNGSLTFSGFTHTAIAVSGGGTFNMYAGTISGNRAAWGHGGGVFVWTDGLFRMYGGTISDNEADISGGGVHVAGGTFQMHGGEIRGNTAIMNGGGVNVANSGILIMEDSIITDNLAAISGATNGGGTFEMHGGEIIDNEAYFGGGGVFITWDSSFVMYDGTISDNETWDGGGGVSLEDATFVMYNGEISGNEAVIGGGVFVSDHSTFRMYNGEISDNTATHEGGGIFTAAFDTYDNLTAADFQNLTIGAAVIFSGNSASEAYVPPANATTLWPNIGFNGTSVPNPAGGYFHAINNFDINFIGNEPMLINQQVVTFNPNGGVFTGGNQLPARTILRNGTYAAAFNHSGVLQSPTLAAPTREGYYFVGWFDTQANANNTTSSTGRVQHTTAVTNTATRTLYARWLTNPFTINIWHSINGVQVGTEPVETITVPINLSLASTVSNFGGIPFDQTLLFTNPATSLSLGQIPGHAFNAASSFAHVVYLGVQSTVPAGFEVDWNFGFRMPFEAVQAQVMGVGIGMPFSTVNIHANFVSNNNGGGNGGSNGDNGGEPTPNPAVQITKSAPATVRPNAEITYTLTVRNTGNVTLTGLTVTDNLPTQLQYPRDLQYPASVTASFTGQNLNATIASLSPGQSITISFVVTVDAPVGQVITNTATVNVPSMPGVSHQSSATTTVTIQQPETTIPPIMPPVLPPGDTTTGSDSDVGLLTRPESGSETGQAVGYEPQAATGTSTDASTETGRINPQTGDNAGHIGTLSATGLAVSLGALLLLGKSKKNRAA